MVGQCQCNIEYDTKHSLENDIGARTIDNDKSAQHFSSFQIANECTIKRPRFQIAPSSSNFQTSFHNAAECSIKRPGF